MKQCWRILVIDDEQTARNTAKNILAEYPIEVDGAESVMRGIEEISREAQQTANGLYFQEQAKCFDLIIVDIQMPVSKAYDWEKGTVYGQQFLKYRRHVANAIGHDEQFQQPETAKDNPNAGFWVISFAIKQLGIPREKFVIYTAREKETYMPFIACPEIGIAIELRRDDQQESVFEKIAGHRLEQTALKWLKHRLSARTKIQLANACGLEDWDAFSQTVLIDDIINGERRQLTLTRAFCFSFKQARSPKAFADFIMKNLYEPITDCLPLLYDGFRMLCHGLDEMLKGSDSYKELPSNFRLRQQLNNFYQHWITHREVLSGELLTHSIRRLVDDLFDDRLEHDLQFGDLPRWYHSLIELYMHYLYTRFPAILLLDWCQENKNWEIDIHSEHNLLKTAPQLEKSIHKCLLNFESTAAIADYLNGHNGHKLWALRSNLLMRAGEAPQFYLSRDYLDSILKAISENSSKDASTGTCEVALLQAEDKFQIIVMHASPGKILSEEDRQRLLTKINSPVMSMVGLRGLRLKLRRMGGQAYVWCKSHSEWDALGEPDRFLTSINFMKRYQPIDAAYLIYIFQF